MRYCQTAVFSAAMLIFCGCDQTQDLDKGEPIPNAMNEAPLPEGSGEAGPWQSQESIAQQGAPGEWTPVDGLNFPTVYFLFDSDALAPSESAKLDRVAAYLNEHAQLCLIVEGHCDQRGTEEYNRALGERRANAISAYLTAHGLSDARLKTLSYGKDRPALEGSGESVWSKNRRGMLIPARKR